MTTVRRKRRKKTRPVTAVRKAAPQSRPAPVLRAGPVATFSWRKSRGKLALGAALIGAAFGWAYWPTLVELVRAWDREPDYSHGYLVAPLALYFCWARRDRFPGVDRKLAWLGLAVILLSIGVRAFGARYYVDAIDGWSMLIWAAGVVWFLGGRRVFWWSLPSIAFLWFMIPLPWRVERWLSLPLQRVATHMSCWLLQFLGQPAFAEGNVIYVGEAPLHVEEACSGLRIFVGVVALAFAYSVLFGRAWWQKALLFLSVIPIALIANSCRIVCTGLLYQYVSGDAAQKFTHDVSGWAMIPFAAALFGLFIWYLGKLLPEVEAMELRDLVKRQGA